MPLLIYFPGELAKLIKIAKPVNSKGLKQTSHIVPCLMWLLSKRILNMAWSLGTVSARTVENIGLQTTVLKTVWMIIYSMIKIWNSSDWIRAFISHSETWHIPWKISVHASQISTWMKIRKQNVVHTLVRYSVVWHTVNPLHIHRMHCDLFYCGYVITSKWIQVDFEVLQIWVHLHYTKPQHNSTKCLHNV